MSKQAMKRTILTPYWKFFKSNTNLNNNCDVETYRVKLKIIFATLDTTGSAACPKCTPGM